MFPFTISGLPSFILNYWNNIATEQAIKNQEACDHLFRNDEYDDLKTEEEKNKYLDSHYQIQVDAICGSNQLPNEINIKVKCIPCDFSKGNLYKCDKKFPKTENYIRKKFLKNTSFKI